MKISDYTENTLPAIADILAMVDDPAGTPLTQKVSIANLLQLEFGQVYTNGGAGTQSPGAAYALCTQVGSNGLSSAGVTPDQANSKITITNTGIYLVAFQLSFVGTNAAATAAQVYWNGVGQAQITMQRTMGAAAAIGSASAIGFVDVSTGATDLDLRIQTSSGIFDVKELQLIAVRIAST